MCFRNTYLAPEGHLEPSQKSKMRPFAKAVTLTLFLLSVTISFVKSYINTLMAKEVSYYINHLFLVKDFEDPAVLILQCGFHYNSNINVF